MKTWNESKEQRKHRKALEKQGLSINERTDYVRGYLEAYRQSTKKNYVICLKWGTKYGPEYVNKLYNMVKRNCTLDYEFICFTDDTQGIDKHIRTEPLPSINLQGWWYKVWFLSNKLPVTGTALFFDLDLVIFRNIDRYFLYKEDSPFVIIRDFNRQVRKNWDRMNSSVFRIKIGEYNNVYELFEKDAVAIQRKYPGDQDFMFANIRNHIFWPDEWVQSYKWEMRGRSELTVVNGKRNFKKPGVPKILPDTSIAVFHGTPNMDEGIDEWPRANWY